MNTTFVIIIIIFFTICGEFINHAADYRDKFIYWYGFVVRGLVIALACLSISLAANAQEFVAPSKIVTNIDSTTTYTYKMPEKTYKVYKSKKGAFYIWKQSKKTGNLYKYYLPKEIQIAMGRKYDK